MNEKDLDMNAKIADEEETREDYVNWKKGLSFDSSYLIYYISILKIEQEQKKRKVKGEEERGRREESEECL